MLSSRLIVGFSLVAASTAAGLAAVSAPAVAADPVGPTVVINEIAQDVGDTDWVELKNTSGAAVDVSGWTLYDNSDERDFALAPGSTIAPGGHLVVDVDVDVEGREGFGLGRADEVRLFRPAADGELLVDRFAWTDHTPTTYARCADGAGDFTTSAAPTPGETNACEADRAASVRINEIESSDPDGGSDWVELTNIGTAPVDLGGLQVLDSEDDHVLTIPEGTVLAAGGFHVIEEPLLSFGLGGTDAVRVLDGTTVVDTYAWEGHAEHTYGRFPDGTGAVTTTAEATKGAPNRVDVGTLPSVVVNEVESSGGVPGDWVELYNAGSADVDLAGFLVGDSDPEHRAVLPAGAVVPAGGFYVVEEAVLGFGLGSNDQARLFLPDGVTVVDERSWEGHAPTSYGRCGDAWAVTTSVTKGAANDCGAPVRINEIESSGGLPGDWVELVNTGTDPVDVSGWVISDSDDDHRFVIPAATTIAAGGYWVADTDAAALGDAAFGLGGADSVRLFDGDTLVDSYLWTAHAPTTYGRCPDGTGAFAVTVASTRGATNLCEGEVEQPDAAPWPGPAEVRVADVAGTYAENLSGLVYSGDGETLWAVQNNPGSLHRLVRSDDLWVAADGWNDGRALRYADGRGNVDAEGVTVGPDALYVATERDNDGGGSRPSILAYDPTGSGDLRALDEWNLAGDLPVIGANAGLEGITWVAADVLVAQGLVDESTGRAYDPAAYPDADGLFFVGVEGTGGVYGYALGDDGGFTRVASFDSGFSGVMELQYEPATDALWVYCDEACGGRSAVFSVDESGGFAASVVYERPGQMPDIANEGLAIAPVADCVDGLREVTWADDASTDGHALRVGAIDCAPVDPGPVDPGEGTAGPISDDLLTEETRGSVEAPDTAHRGETITVRVDPVLTGTAVEVWLHSSPRLVATAVVAAGGSLTVTIPDDATLGDHRLVVLDAAGPLIGWDDLRIVAADRSTGGPTGSEGSSGGILPDTGAPVSIPMLLGALVLVVGGATFLLAGGRRTA